MAKKIYYDDENIGLGCFSFPILTVNDRMESLRLTNPQMTELERAAVAYFGMLAEQPKPTRSTNVYKLGYFDNVDIEKWLEAENYGKYHAFGLATIRPEETDAQTAYLTHVNKLQNWLQHFGLWEGIQKTLNEQSRKKQAEKAANDESKAAAARALAYSQITEEMSEEARREAAEAQGRAQDQLNAALLKEEQLKKELENLANGLPADFGTARGISWPVVAGVCALAYILFKKRGRK